VAIYLIRHAQSEGNARRVFQGSCDYPLTPRGREQAQALARWLAALPLSPQRIFTSPLKRAAQTAEILAACLGADPPALLPELREYHAGEIEGLTLDELGERFPEYLTRGLDERGDFSVYGGESRASMHTRLKQFIARVQADHADQDILVVSHGGSLYQLLQVWCAWPTPRHIFTRMSNCCCLKLGLREVAAQQVAELQWFVTLELIGPQLLADPSAAAENRAPTE
jgi:broad specificity phosphatase PhoE